MSCLAIVWPGSGIIRLRLPSSFHQKVPKKAQLFKSLLEDEPRVIFEDLVLKEIQPNSIQNWKADNWSSVAWLQTHTSRRDYHITILPYSPIHCEHSGRSGHWAAAGLVPGGDRCSRYRQHSAELSAARQFRADTRPNNTSTATTITTTSPRLVWLTAHSTGLGLGVTIPSV